MLQITELNGKQFSYVIAGSLTATDLAIYYYRLDRQFRQHGRLHLSVTVESFTGYRGWDALRLFLRHEPGLLRRVATYTMRTDQPLLRTAVRLLSLFIRRIEFHVEPLPQRKALLTLDAVRMN